MTHLLIFLQIQQKICFHQYVKARKISRRLDVRNIDNIRAYVAYACKLSKMASVEKASKFTS